MIDGLCMLLLLLESVVAAGVGCFYAIDDEEKIASFARKRKDRDLYNRCVACIGVHWVALRKFD